MPHVLMRGIELYLVRQIPKNTDRVVSGLILTRVIILDWVVSCKLDDTKEYW